MVFTTIATDKIIPIQVQTIATSSATLAIDLSLGQYIIVTLNQTITTMTFSNWPAVAPTTGVGTRITLEIRNTGAFNITGWGGAKWTNGIAPTVTSGNGKLDVYTIFTGDGGVYIYGAVIGQNFS